MFQTREDVRGYKRKGTSTRRSISPFANQIDGFSLAIDVIDRAPRLHVAGAHVNEKLRNKQIECQNYAYEHGVDKPEVDQWTWPWATQEESRR